MAGLLSSLFTKRWTMTDLMNIDQARQSKSSGCSVSLERVYSEVTTESILDKFKRFFTRSKNVMNVYYVIFKFQVTSDTGHSYKVFLRTQYDPGARLYMKNTIEVYCECADFKYNSAYELSQHSALFRSDRTETALGQATTNAPKKKRGTVLCKHSYAALMYLVNNYKNLMDNV